MSLWWWQEEVLARVGEGCAWKNTFNGIPLDASISLQHPTQRVFKVLTHASRNAAHCAACTSRTSSLFWCAFRDLRAVQSLLMSRLPSRRIVKLLSSTSLSVLWVRAVTCVAVVQLGRASPCAVLAACNAVCNPWSPLSVAHGPVRVWAVFPGRPVRLSCTRSIFWSKASCVGLACALTPWHRCLPCCPERGLAQLGGA